MANHYRLGKCEITKYIFHQFIEKLSERQMIFNVERTQGKRHSHKLPVCM